MTWTGHAIEMRINAEDPVRKFLPNPKRIGRWVAPAGPGVRVDSGFGPGLGRAAQLRLAGRQAHRARRRPRRGDRARGARALREFVVVGPATTISYHRAILESADFRAGNLSTRFIEDHPELVEQARKLGR